jgi:hypothetical protein
MGHYFLSNPRIYCVWNTLCKSTITNMGVVVVMLMMPTMTTTIMITMTCQKHKCVSVSCIFVNSNAPAVLSMIQILWNVMSCWLVNSYWCLGGSYCPHLQGQGILFLGLLDLEEKSTTTLKNVGNYSPNNTASLPGRPESLTFPISGQDEEIG